MNLRPPGYEAPEACFSSETTSHCSHTSHFLRNMRRLYHCVSPVLPHKHCISISTPNIFGVLDLWKTQKHCISQIKSGGEIPRHSVDHGPSASPSKIVLFIDYGTASRMAFNSSCSFGISIETVSHTMLKLIPE